MSQLIIRKGNQKLNIEYVSRSPLRDLLISNGVEMEFPCGGNGSCGKCTVLLNGEEVLACRTMVQGDCEVILPQDAVFHPVEGRRILKSRSNGHKRLGAAVDLGTTTIEAKIVDLDTGEVIQYDSLLNPQRRFGADVISRMQASMAGQSVALKLLSENGIYQLVNSLLPNRRKRLPEKLEKMVIAGNTTMLYLLTGRNPRALSAAPFLMDHAFGERDRLFGVSVFYPNCLHAFCGADMAAAIVASGMIHDEAPAILADFGTNGEIALMYKGKLYVTSTAAGPAFEKPGLIGSEIIDAIAWFLNTGQIDHTGMTIHLEESLDYQGKFTLNVNDIRDVQLAKAAIYAGIVTLLKQAKCSIRNVHHLYIAGNFGAHINYESAVRIGMIPKRLLPKAKCLGNAALNGAAMLLYQEEAMQDLAWIAENAIHVDLGGNPMFNQEFLQNMGFEL